ncbi:MAG: nodulation protein NfeD [Gemmatimonadetes bacterium]|nr:nodulation protein NfeD [Gemmatimonadota bacterium]
MTACGGSRTRVRSQRGWRGWTGVRLANLVFVALVAAGFVGAAALYAGPQEQTVVFAPVQGEIEMGLAPFVERVLEEAAETGAAAVILEMDTPGGRVDAAWRIVDALRESEVPVYTFINPRALSAGAMIALATDGIYMRGGGSIGAATPVVGDQKASEKMVSAMRSEFRALAEERGLDPTIGEAMVDEAVDLPGYAPEGRLLTLTTSEAVEIGVAVAQVDGAAAVLEDIGLTGAVEVESAPSWAEALVRFLTMSQVAPLLLSLGMVGVFMEIRSPGFGIPGALGIASLAAFFGAHHLVHLAGVEELLLLGAGVILIAVEVFVIPGMGVAGILGAGAILGASVMSMLGRFPTFGDVFNAMGLVALSIILASVSAWALVRHLPRSRWLSGVYLRETTDRDTGYLSAPERDDLIGARGVALTDLRPAGTALINEERVDVVTEGPWIEADTAIEIVSADGYRHVVRAV